MKTNIKTLAIAIALAGTAATASANVVGPSHLGNLSGKAIAIGNSFASGAAINDIYTFDIHPLSSAAGTAVTLNYNLFPGFNTFISNFNIAFLDSSNTVIVQDAPTHVGDTTLNISALLNAGTNYQFRVTGIATGTLGGSYGGALAAAPVPEAETWAMLLAGLGLLGFMASRRMPV